jgi:hypothetical protein
VIIAATIAALLTEASIGAARPLSERTLQRWLKLAAFACVAMPAGNWCATRLDVYKALAEKGSIP